MPITETMIAGVLRTARTIFPGCVVTCNYTYTDGGTTRTQSFVAMRGSINAQQRLSITGSATTEAFSLVVDVAELDTVHPKEGERIKIQVGDDPETEHTIITRNEDALKSIITFIVGPKHG